MFGVSKRLSRSISLLVYCLRNTDLLRKWNTDIWRSWRNAARFSKASVNTEPNNLPGRLTGNFTVPGKAFSEAPVDFLDTFRPHKIAGCYHSLTRASRSTARGEKKTWNYTYSKHSILLKARLSLRLDVLFFMDTAKFNFEVIIGSEESNWETSGFCMVILFDSGRH